MAPRTTFTQLSPPPVPGGGASGFVAEYAARMKQLFDATALPLTAIGGTANALTATLDPVLDGGGLVDGMKFTLTFAATNTGGMTLAINGGSALAVLDNTGTALIAGAVGSGMRAMVEYIGGAFRILTEINAAAAGGSGPYALTITASTTWTRPAGYAADTLVRFEAWGAGGGGVGGSADRGGGGGGQYIERVMRYADVPTSVVITIGAGGAATAAGGNTTVGSLATAYGGGGGNNLGAGGGGGELQQGLTNNAAGSKARIGGGKGGDNAVPLLDRHASTLWGGGAGGNGNIDGGSAVFGAAGGGGRSVGGTSSPGASVFGGQGGTSSTTVAGGAGQAPGGGGGCGTTGGAGARGEVRIQILG